MKRLSLILFGLSNQFMLFAQRGKLMPEDYMDYSDESSFSYGPIIVLLVIIGIIYVVRSFKSESNRSKQIREKYNYNYYGDRAEDAYEKGKYGEAVRYAKLGSSENEARSQTILGLCYLNGEGINPDIDMAFNYISKSANQGYVYGQFLLGLCYEEGLGTSKNLLKALQCFTDVINNEYSEQEEKDSSIEERNKLYGKIADEAYISDNYADAVRYGELGTTYSCSLAMIILGKCYLFGKGVPQNSDKAIYLYRKAANMGYWKAQYELGECYQYGYGVAKNYSIAYQWYKKVIDNPDVYGRDFSDAEKNLNYCNKAKYGEFASQAYKERNYADAVKYGEIGANLGDITSMAILGDCYMFGNGVSKDFETAASYYQKSGEYNYWYAQYRLGYCYQHGLGVIKDYAIARQCYAKAIERPNADKSTVDKALSYYKECNNGVPYINESNFDERLNNALNARNGANLIKYMEIEANQNNVEAMKFLGEMYKDGSDLSSLSNVLSIKQDHAAARYWYKKIIENPNVDKDTVEEAMSYYKECNNGVPYNCKSI